MEYESVFVGVDGNAPYAQAASQVPQITLDYACPKTAHARKGSSLESP